jgi:hypothetical protein
VLRNEERDQTADERTHRGEQLERHAEPEIRRPPLEVDPGCGAARHDHAHEADADRLDQREPERERQERDDQRPPTQPQQRAEDACGEPTAQQDQPVSEHVEPTPRSAGGEW